MRVAVFQFDVRRGDVEGNLARVEEGLAQAASLGVDLLVLPEMWPTSFVGDRTDAHWLEQSSRALERLRALSRTHGLAVCGSAFGAGEEGERNRNRLMLFDRGEELLSYDKVHLFTPTGEALGFSAGRRPPATVELRGVSVSGIICYDLRFPPVLRRPFKEGAELLIVPAQWPVPRAAHWSALLVGRAVEHQAFVVGANRTGHDRMGRRGVELDFPGNSLVVSPHGATLAEGRGEQGLVVAELDLEELRQLRRRVPVRQDQRPDLYDAWLTPPSA